MPRQFDAVVAELDSGVKKLSQPISETSRVRSFKRKKQKEQNRSSHMYLGKSYLH